MNSPLDFKKLLIKLAGLTKTDQKWVLRHLPEKQKDLFKQMQGEQLLKQAQAFRKLGYESSHLPDIHPVVPAYPESLAKYSDLYIAIVLKQGNFPWQEAFLTSFDKENAIKTLLNNPLHHIKEAAREALFKQWQAQQSFDVYLEKQYD